MWQYKCWANLEPMQLVTKLSGAVWWLDLRRTGSPMQYGNANMKHTINKIQGIIHNTHRHWYNFFSPFSKIIHKLLPGFVWWIIQYNSKRVWKRPTWGWQRQTRYMFVKVIVDVCRFIGALAFVLHCFIGWRAKEVNKKQIDAQRKQLEAGTNNLAKERNISCSAGKYSTAVLFQHLCK